MSDEKKRGPGRPPKEEKQESAEPEEIETTEFEIEAFEEEGVEFCRTAVKSIIKKCLDFNRIDTPQENDEYLDAAIVGLHLIAKKLIQSATGSGDFMQIMCNAADYFFVRPVMFEIARLTEKRKIILAQYAQMNKD